jgi:hypothetical protein
MLQGHNKENGPETRPVVKLPRRRRRGKNRD